MKRPFYYRKKEPKKVSVETLFRALELIETHGSRDEFVKLCEEKDLDVEVPQDLINLAKKYMFDRKMHKLSDTGAYLVGKTPDPRC